MATASSNKTLIAGNDSGGNVKLVFRAKSCRFICCVLSNPYVWWKGLPFGDQWNHRVPVLLIYHHQIRMKTDVLFCTYIMIMLSLKYVINMKGNKNFIKDKVFHCKKCINGLQICTKFSMTNNRKQCYTILSPVEKFEQKYGKDTIYEFWADLD